MSMAARLREAGLIALYRAGWPGALGAVLLVAAVLLAAFVGAALDARHEALDAERLRLARSLPQAAGGRAAPNPAERLARFHGAFPPLQELPGILTRLHAHADRYGLDLARADYQSSEETGTPLLRVSLNLPVRGEFGDVYRWLGELLGEMPELALEAVSVRRGDTEVGVVDAELRLSLFVRRAP